MCAMFVDPRVREAELAFLNAPFRADGWQLAVERMAGVTGSYLGQLCGVAGGRAVPYNILSDQPHDPHRHLDNPALYGDDNWRIRVSRGVLEIRHDLHYAPFQKGARATFYNDAVADLGIQHGCQTALSLCGDDILGLALLRSPREGPCDAWVLDAFARLARQAQRAMRVQMALGQQSAELMLEGVAGSGEATILLDRFGAIVALSEAADALFDRPGCLTIEGHRCRPALPAEAAPFESAVARLLASDGVTGPIVHEFRFGRTAADPRPRWRGMLARLPDGQCQLGFAPELALTVTPL